MAARIVVSRHLPYRVLVTREAARKLEPFIRAVAVDTPEICIDFHGAAGIAPSFFDELLLIVDDVSGTTAPVVKIANPPTEPSRKFAVIAGAHHRSLSLDDSGGWVLASRVGAIGQTRG